MIENEDFKFYLYLKKDGKSRKNNFNAMQLYEVQHENNADIMKNKWQCSCLVQSMRSVI